MRVRIAARRDQPMHRRTFLAALPAMLPAAALRVQVQERLTPIIDTHIHLFDQTRPQGAPYAGGRPPGSTAPTLPSYPPRYRALARPLGIVGAIAVEASPWIEDNLWLLEAAQTDTMIVGVIGDLEPDKPEFAEYLDRYHKNPLFLGIRYGNLWGRDLTKQAENATFVAGVKRLGDAGLVFETANPRIQLLEAIVRITDQVSGRPSRARPHARADSGRERTGRLRSASGGTRQPSEDLLQAVECRPPD